MPSFHYFDLCFLLSLPLRMKPYLVLCGPI